MPAVFHHRPRLTGRTKPLSCPRPAPGADPDDAMAAARASGAIPIQAKLEEALKAHGKTYEFHSYKGAGHAFLQVDRPSYRPEAAVDAWRRIWAFLGRYLLSSVLGKESQCA